MNRPFRAKLVALDSDAIVLRDIAEIAAPHFETIRVRDVARAMATCQEDPDVRAFVAAHAVHPATGTSVFEYLRERCPTVRRIMLTSYGDLTIIVNGLHSGAIQYLAYKPLNHQELLTVLTNVSAALPAAPSPLPPALLAANAGRLSA